MRARLPDREGVVEETGIAYSVYENDGPTVLLLPTWAIIHSRHWKLQLPYLARHFRVVTYDGPGNGRSPRSTDPTAYSDDAAVAHAVDVLDATGTGRAVLAGVSLGAHWAALVAARHPERALGAVLIGAYTSLVGPHRHRTLHAWEAVLDTDEGWAKYNRHYWTADYPGFVDFFFSQAFSEPHSTKPREDCARWAAETTPDVLIATQLGEMTLGEAERRALAAVACPVLVVQGTDDRIRPPAGGPALAEATGGSLLTIEGGGHLPHARDPVAVNLAIRRFVETTTHRGAVA